MTTLPPLDKLPRRLGRGVLRGRYLPRQRDPVALVVHTTGGGPLRRAKRWGSSPLEAALRIYERLTDAGPHFVVSQQGEVVQVCPLELCAWGVGSRGARRYLRPGWEGRQQRRFGWWRRKWGGRYQSPLQMAEGRLWLPYEAPDALAERLRLLARSAAFRQGRALSCNANVVHVEVVPPLAGPRAPWTEAARETVRALAEAVAARYGFPCDEQHVLTHSDVHPLARTTRGGEPWDPWSVQWPAPLRAGVEGRA